MYDYLIVGSGFFGSICAYELNKRGYKVCVIDKRNHIGGNCYTSQRDGINIHEYGPHIFHTSNEMVWNWINQFVKFNNFRLSPVANYKGKLYSLPFNLWTFYQVLGVGTPIEVKNIIENDGIKIKEPSNLEEQSIKFVGNDVYNILIKGYTEKQWKKSCSQLPKEIIKRLPIRFTYDSNYFNDLYQGIPIGGYTQIFEKLLSGIDVRLNTDYFSDILPDYKKLIYTGPIDKFYNYKFGELEYKTTKFEHTKIDIDNFQGCAIMNFTDIDVEYTRIIEHKHFENVNSNSTWITYEYPIDYNSKNTEPYYPLNDVTNNEKYRLYKNLMDSETDIIFGGRLAEYKYYDMDGVIESALNKVNKIINENEN